MNEPVARAVADAHREHWARVLAATARAVRDLDLAEECVQEAYAGAVVSWQRDGVPRNPAAWLTTAARRRAIDAVRREHALRSKLPLLPRADGADEAVDVTVLESMDDPEDLPDDRLRLVFTCCHPALAPEARVALTLRLVGGLSTRDIARSFLVAEPTMAARIGRAKKKISLARIPYRVPRAAELPERLDAVLQVLHLLYTTGHTAPTGPDLVRLDLIDTTVRMARMLVALMPDETEARGLLALVLDGRARRSTRADAAGRPVRLAEQDRSRWDPAELAEARALVNGCLRSGAPGRYTLQAAIAATHAEAPTFEQTDWERILVLYDALLRRWPNPVAALNRAVAISMTEGPAAALVDVDRLGADDRMAGYPYLWAVRADLLTRLGRCADAAAAYRVAIENTGNDAERAVLVDRLAELAG